MWSSRRQQPEILAQLKLPQVASIRDLRHEETRRTGRAVHIEAAETVLGRRCGVCYVTENAFYIFYDPRTSRAHQDHVIGHEIAHVLLGHHEARRPSEAVPQGFAPLLDPALVEMMLARSSYEEAEEHDAELLASYLYGRVIEHRLRNASPPGDDTQERIAHTLLSRREAER